MASTSTKAAGTKSILTPSVTLKGHGLYLRSISYFPDGKRMISGSYDMTARQWDLKAGKEIKEARDVCKEEVWAVAVSRDSRWVVTGGGDHDRPELKACEVETGIVKKLRGHSQDITCVDTSADNTLLASGSLVAGPFESFDLVGAARFSTDSKKLTVKSTVGNFACTEDDDVMTIYEFNVSTLETVGPPFEGHTKSVIGLALSFDAFESCQLLASFDVQNPRVLILSPNSRQLIYTTSTGDAYKICICNIPLDVLAQAGTIARKKPALSNLLNSDATRRPAARHRRPPIPVIPVVQRPPPTIDPQQPINIFVRLSTLLRFSRTNPVHPGRNDEPHDPLDFSAILPLPRPLSGHSAHLNSGTLDHYQPPRLPANVPTTFTAHIHHLSSRWPIRGGLAQTPIVDVPLAQAKEARSCNAAAGAPNKNKDIAIVPIEYIDPPSPNPDSQQPATAVQPATGEHGNDRSCFCF
ncbi:hypothetical protein BDR05DRAFT_971273 [Suillus weaverae]|nr:hypothetical protein BDR05DRAFT_971273 [Suillus weaverae]